MRSTCLAGMAILLASAAAVWAQDSHFLDPSLIKISDGSLPDVAPSEPIPSIEKDLKDSGANDPSAVGDESRLFGSAEALLWWTKPGNSPPLVTAGTLDSLGALGPGTTTLFGGDLNDGLRLGGRFTLGYWLNCDHTEAIEAGYFFLSGPAPQRARGQLPREFIGRAGARC